MSGAFADGWGDELVAMGSAVGGMGRLSAPAAGGPPAAAAATAAAHPAHPPAPAAPWLPVVPCRHLHIPLVQAERAWAYAMDLKSQLEEAAAGAQKRQHLVRRLAKAASHSAELVALTAARCDARTQVWKEGSRCFCCCCCAGSAAAVAVLEVHQQLGQRWAWPSAAPPQSQSLLPRLPACLPACLPARLPEHLPAPAAAA